MTQQKIFVWYRNHLWGFPRHIHKHVISLFLICFKLMFGFLQLCSPPATAPRLKGVNYRLIGGSRQTEASVSVMVGWEIPTVCVFLHPSVWPTLSLLLLFSHQWLIGESYFGLGRCCRAYFMPGNGSHWSLHSTVIQRWLVDPRAKSQCCKWKQ